MILSSGSDGSATYNFCVVVDDMDSKITHVIRGDDHAWRILYKFNAYKALGHSRTQIWSCSNDFRRDGKCL